MIIRIYIQGGADIDLHGDDALEMFDYLKRYGDEKELLERGACIISGKDFVRVETEKYVDYR